MKILDEITFNFATGVGVVEFEQVSVAETDNFFT